MANISFKKGKFEAFEKSVLGIERQYDENEMLVGVVQKAANIQEGTLYFTEDEGCLYVGVKDAIGASSVKRIQGSVVCYDNILKFKEDVIDNPPYSTDVIYFISQSNALIKWNGTEQSWIQLNITVDEFTKQVSNITNALDAEIGRATAKENEIVGNVGQIQQRISDIEGTLEDTVSAGDYANAIGEITESIGALTQDIADSNTQLATVQQKVNSAIDENGAFIITKPLNMNGKQIENVAAGTANTDAVNKKQLDDAISPIDSKITSIQGTSDLHATSISDLQTAVGSINQKFEKVKIDDDGKIQLQNDLDINSHTISNLNMGATILDTDAANVGYVKSLVKANEAMTFMGTLGTSDGTISTLELDDQGYYNVNENSPLYEKKPQQGDTFKVSTEGTYSGIKAKVGDLIINNGEDDEAPNWVHIQSGYDAATLQKLILEDGTIYLTDGLTENSTTTLGGVTISSDCPNLSISSSMDSTSKITTIKLDMIWSTF